MLTEITIEEYLDNADQLPIIDVRSPGEYKKGHIPGALNVPLFSDKERAHIGTVYVQRSKNKAIELGYKYVEPKLKYYIDKAQQTAANNKLAVHCWRGGMRSKVFAEHIESIGIDGVYVIKGGYKAFRKQALKNFETDCRLYILGGYTGSGKTQILKHLKAKGEQIIDLEELANHKGSVFGGMGKTISLTSEQFENNLFWQWKNLDFSLPVWIEDESATIGPVHIPASLYHKMRESHVVFLDIPKEKRAKFLVSEYSDCDKTVLANNIRKISKRLGGLHTTEAINWLEKDNYFEAVMLVLNYYDKYYKKGLSKRGRNLVKHIKIETLDHVANADLVSDSLKHLTNA